MIHLLLLLTHTHRHLLLLLLVLLLLLLLVESTSHLTIVVVLIVVLPLILVVMLVTVAVGVVTFHISTTSALATTSSMLVSLASAHVLITIILIVVMSLTHIWITTLHSWWSSLILRSVLFLDCIDQFSDVVDVFISDCILSLVFSLPEVNSEWLDLVSEESHSFIEKLNGLLCLFDTLIENITDLVFRSFNSKLIDFVIFELD